MKFWSEGMAKQHALHLKTWFRFCAETGLEPLSADLQSGAEFMTQSQKIQL